MVNHDNTPLLYADYQSSYLLSPAFLTGKKVILTSDIWDIRQLGKSWEVVWDTKTKELLPAAEQSSAKTLDICGNPKLPQEMNLRRWGKDRGVCPTESMGSETYTTQSLENTPFLQLSRCKEISLEYYLGVLLGSTIAPI